MLKHIRANDVDYRVLTSFTAISAKWRYETTAHAMWCLNKLRLICETYMTPLWFKHVQDTESINTVMGACKDVFC